MYQSKSKHVRNFKNYMKVEPWSFCAKCFCCWQDVWMLTCFKLPLPCHKDDDYFLVVIDKGDWFSWLGMSASMSKIIGEFIACHSHVHPFQWDSLFYQLRYSFLNKICVCKFRIALPHMRRKQLIQNFLLVLGAGGWFYVLLLKQYHAKSRILA